MKTLNNMVKTVLGCGSVILLSFGLIGLGAGGVLSALGAHSGLLLLSGGYLGGALLLALILKADKRSGTTTA